MSAPKMHVPVIVTDGGPWATHDHACSVCHERKSILDLGTGRFDPCDRCKAEGWRLVKIRGSWWQRWMDARLRQEQT